MLLSAISVGNYKSFFEPQSIKVGPGINLLIGANNSGKTTILEALDLELGAQSPHRSIWNLPNYGDLPTGRSSLSVSLTTSISELRSLFGDTILVPIPDNYHDGLAGDQDIPTQLYARLFENPELSIELDLGGGQGYFVVVSELGKTKRVHINSDTTVHVLHIRFDATSGDVIELRVLQQRGQPASLQYLEAFKKYFYRFSAQRYPAAQSGFSGPPVALNRDAANLAFCISNLQLNDAYGHGLLCDLVHRVFPTIRWIQAPSQAVNQWEIRCLPRVPQERRDDLSVPLSQMGAGIGNVIAILYVILTSRQPRVIAIDEPNSFLHPKALRELLQILSAEGGQHQYLLTGHSADIVSSAQPTLVSMFSAGDGRTRIRQVDGDKLEELRGELCALGIRMTDLHGRDRVLWVEGQTEELVMPILLKVFCPEFAAGTAVLRVEHTSKFDRSGKEVEAVVAAYERLTSSALVPPAIAILIDTEKRDAKACRKLEKDTAGRLRFLPRAMLENYALHADAVAAILNLAGEDVTKEGIEQLLKAEAAGEDADDGAKVLHNVFHAATNARVVFRKTTHTPQIFAWLLREDSTHLDELRDFLRGIFETLALTLPPASR